MTSRRSILTLDLGTTMGWAKSIEHPGPRVILSGKEILQTSRLEGGGMRYLRFREWLHHLHQDSAEIYFEEVRRHIGTTAGHVYGGYVATLTSWCEETHTPYESVPVGTIKKFITGKGNAGKDQVIKAVNNLGYNVTDDNEADALALLHYVLDRKRGR